MSLVRDAIAPVDWISDSIAIGNYLDATDTALHRAGGIRSLLCLDGKLSARDADRLALDELVSVPLTDDSGSEPAAFLSAVRAVERLSEEHPGLLVQCHAGRSRSVAVVAAHLMHKLRLRPQQALDYIAERRAVVVSPGMERLLRSLWQGENR